MGRNIGFCVTKLIVPLMWQSGDRSQRCPRARNSIKDLHTFVWQIRVRGCAQGVPQIKEVRILELSFSASDAVSIGGVCIARHVSVSLGLPPPEYCQQSIIELEIDKDELPTMITECRQSV